MDARCTNAKRAIAIEFDGGGEGWTEVAEALVAGDWWLVAGDGLRFEQSKRMGVMSVQKFGDAGVVFAYDASDAGERQFQFVGRGCDRKKYAGLDRAGMHRFK